MDGLRDYYQILGVRQDATTEEIQQTYHFLALSFHPDKHSDAKKAYAEQRMAEVNEAYSVLRDPVRRAEYDRRLGRKPERGGASADDAAEVAYRAAHEMVELIKTSGFLESISGKVREYRDRAISQLAAVVTRWPHSEWAIPAQFDIMMLYATVETAPSPARQAARKLAEMAPGTELEDAATMVTAMMYVPVGRADEALKLLEALSVFGLSAQARAEAVFHMAEVQHGARGNRRAAIAAYRRLVREHPADDHCAAARYAIARILDSDLHEYSEAVSMYQEVLQYHPRSKEASDCQWRIDYIRRAHPEAERRAHPEADRWSEPL